MTKQTMIIAGIVALLVVAVAANSFLGKSDTGVVDSDNGNLTVTTDEGTWSSSDKLPSNFPSDVPLYPGAKVQASVEAAQQQGGGIYAGLETNDALDKVVDWYKKQVVAKGWESMTNYEVNGGLMLSATKDGRDLVVTISEAGDTVAIGLVVTEK